MSADNQQEQEWRGVAEFAGLRQQVVGLETDYRDLKLVVVNLDKKIDSQFAALSAKFDNRSQTPWPTIIAFATFLLLGMSSLGYLARQPLADGIVDTRVEQLHSRERQDKIRSDVDYMRGKFGIQ